MNRDELQAVLTHELRLREMAFQTNATVWPIDSTQAIQRTVGSAKGQRGARCWFESPPGIHVFSGRREGPWLLDSTPLRHSGVWLADAAPLSHWYLERIAGTPVFARLIPLGEMIGGLALAAGFWTRLVAASCLSPCSIFRLPPVRCSALPI